MNHTKLETEKYRKLETENPNAPKLGEKEFWDTVFTRFSKKTQLGDTGLMKSLKRKFVQIRIENFSIKNIQ
jgi:hypothetical protein